MAETSNSEKTNRRDFLKFAATSAPAAVAAVAVGSTEAAAATEAQTGTSGLKDTAQTRAYYNSARF
ncbi:ubiquinol-cytochrome c reductase iron-sulfur subunit N-terminal domain-containing protein [Actibacterium sp. MT2.3-13A]|uniref:ubiquinol-cytochrome c reductase iron-sulfur subunit N-terminal domain-containing protein n=1 Tax=Actibacterium sp. MT2.3-13A TaxID=2828332 RepID=UPI001BA77A6B|nr:ubiquinol-cytochrome c reductase iron-sulfur subunit N-terminal domain-containing protein [Actibacterium sp. MT2.3-13A]